MNSRNTRIPRLTLVGAGPGEPGMINLKGIKAIGTADVILYGELTDLGILALAPSSTRRINVGKRNNSPGYTQEQINSLIVDLAFTYGHVVRLKSGDPAEAENSAEELAYADLFNIETAVIPALQSVMVTTGVRVPTLHESVSRPDWLQN